MDRADLASRRRTLDVPTKPESGLAEWTSKIKAIQRQVDEDEEAETKRLEEEIAASRMARMRRSTGRGTSTDLSKSDVAAALKENDGPGFTPAVNDEPRSTEDRRRNQEDTLKKLSGADSQTRAQADYNSYLASKNKTSSPGAPMSLAAFIGGKAAGPRLNKHAPQQDAHDPTQFEQSAMRGPHPIFGRGGVAMPGMANRMRSGGLEQREETPSPKPVPTRTPDRDVLSNATPFESSKVRSFVAKTETQRESSTPALLGTTQTDMSRLRTISTPNATPPSQYRASFAPPVQESKVERLSPRPLSYSPSPARELSRPITPKERASPSAGHVFPARTNTASPIRHSPPIRSPSPPKSPGLNSTPGLAKPIQPTPRSSFQGPQIPLSSDSTSFLRAPQTKEPTPSISRLQGRGFVQSVVRASGRLEASSTSSSPSALEKARDPPRKSSVLDRWQHGGDSPPVIAPKPIPMRKSRTEDPSLSSQTGSMTPVAVLPTYTPPLKSDFPSSALRSRASFPSLSGRQEQSQSQVTEAATDSPTPSQRRNLGSSTTMVSYIKPLKTGDGPSSPPQRPSSAASRGRTTTPGVDELGVRVRSRTRSIGAASREREDKHSGAPGAGAGGKPLSHPTKSRPHKPRKAKTTSMLATKDEIEPERTQIGGSSNAGVSPQTSVSAVEAPRPVGQLKAPENKDVERASIRSESPPTPGASRRVHFPLDIPPEQPVTNAEKSPSTPAKHTRIPSTGNRATVMEVAQIFGQHEHLQTSAGDPLRSPIPELSPLTVSSPTAEEEIPPKLDVKSMVASWGTQVTSPPSPIERRKSSYEKYSAFTLPPLAEEKTPVPSPASTLARNAVPPTIESVVEEENPIVRTSVAEVASPLVQREHTVSVPDRPAVQDAYVHIDHVDEYPLPSVNVDALLGTGINYKPNPDIQTISIEVMSIVGNTASAITHDSNVFYDTELLAIIYRSKAKSSGLVSTKVWAWRGVKSQLGEREERKLQDLARRYNTPLILVKQYAEPAELVYILGGQVATRQGTRAHWSAENTAMHLVRAVDDMTYIDELELNIKNLCSGFSYCLSLLETVYVWHGRGSSAQEKQAALAYARSLSANVIEFNEEDGNEDEMFWIILGEGDYGKADYWQWKPSSQPWYTRIWLIDGDIITPLAAITDVDDVHGHVYLVDCIWEYFILVGSGARGQRRDIRLALNIATEMSAKLAPTRPYAPNVHVLVLPSKLPIDLRLTFRDMDESHLNQGNIPDHMNLLPAREAFEHLEKSSWKRSVLRDPEMLPLGLASAL